MLAFCLKHSLPVNDSWLFWSQAAATAASHTLSNLTLDAPTTSEALLNLQQLCGKFPDHSMRITGTYPHAEWQGSRIEGFVVAQGEPTDAEVLRDFRKLADASSDACMMVRMTAPPTQDTDTTGTACEGSRTQNGAAVSECSINSSAAGAALVKRFSQLRDRPRLKCLSCCYEELPVVPVEQCC
jgi:hypothetical protein